MQMISVRIKNWSLVLVAVILLWGCSSPPGEITLTSRPIDRPLVRTPDPTETSIIETTKNMESSAEEKVVSPTVSLPGGNAVLPQAEVLSVEVTGSENAYQFTVEIRSPDTGCEQYADWWEVISEDGELLYRRILTHSHVNEQPFTRSGGPVEIRADRIVIVRAHMFPSGYGSAASKGSVQDGFEAIQLEPNFAATLERVDPLPAGCAF